MLKAYNNKKIGVWTESYNRLSYVRRLVREYNVYFILSDAAFGYYDLVIIDRMSDKEIKDAIKNSKSR